MVAADPETPMTYDLFIAARTYSSWSLRAWLLLDRFDLPVRVRMTGLYTGRFAEDLEPLKPARLVPVLHTPEGEVIGESLAIAETLAERHPQAGLWPADPAARARARWLAAEMHAGFQALRSDCPMQLLHQYRGFEPSQEVLDDLGRLEEIWSAARRRFGQDAGPWLCGGYSIADAFYAPVAARIAGYDLPVGNTARDYVAAHLADPSFRRWRALALTERIAPAPYPRDLPTAFWPGPAPLPARAVEEGLPLNETCPYSGKPATHLLEIEGRRFGFCNAVCRDKTVNDPAAWPAFMKLYTS